MVNNMRRILLTISYDGTDYSGWQVQKDHNIRTVQGELNKACSKLFKTDIMSIGASRTDAGVHAVGQRAVIDVDTSIPTEKIHLAINSFLPNDVVIVCAEDVSSDFNPRFQAERKIYEYRIYNNRYWKRFSLQHGKDNSWNADLRRKRKNKAVRYGRNNKIGRQDKSRKNSGSFRAYVG